MLKYKILHRELVEDWYKYNKVKENAQSAITTTA
jgi:hypothetical protein